MATELLPCLTCNAQGFISEKETCPQCQGVGKRLYETYEKFVKEEPFVIRLFPNPGSNKWEAHVREVCVGFFDSREEGLRAIAAEMPRALNDLATIKKFATGVVDAELSEAPDYLVTQRGFDFSDKSLVGDEITPTQTIGE